MNSGTVFLTGATGFLGRYLLRELLAVGRPVAVLARDDRDHSANERVDELLAFGSESLGRVLPRPVVLRGDLSLPGLGLSSTDRLWLTRHCQSALHAAACVALRRSFDGEPWKTNVEGTRRLLELCHASGITEFHHVSTAFVCGKTTGPVREDEPHAARDFHNEYEHSKLEAERLVRSAPGLRATFYRPSVIVGDSLTGYTSSYQGFYRFLDLGHRLAEPASPGRRFLPLRLPFSGTEPRNLVPVDWVARAVVRIAGRPDLHGRTYHLTSPEPVLARVVKEVAEEMLAVDGVSWGGPGKPAGATALEETFREHVQEFWPYLDGDPVFDSRNTQSALPDLPCPRVDRDLLARLIRFAVADRWGRSRRGKARGRVRFDCAAYVERFFPESAARSALAQLPLDITLGLDVRGPGGGRWVVRLRPGEAAEVRRGIDAASAVYRTDVATFEAVVNGRQTPQEVFFARRIEVEGDVEKALKLAVLFGQFVRECPYPPGRISEENDAACVPA